MNWLYSSSPTWWYMYIKLSTTSQSTLYFNSKWNKRIVHTNDGCSLIRLLSFTLYSSSIVAVTITFQLTAIMSMKSVSRIVLVMVGDRQTDGQLDKQTDRTKSTCLLNPHSFFYSHSIIKQGLVMYIIQENFQEV